MFTKKVNDVELAVANQDGAVNAGLRWVLGPKDEMPNCHLRVVELGEAGKSMHHQHDYEHQVFVLEGNGWLVGENDKLELKPGIAPMFRQMKFTNFRMLVKRPSNSSALSLKLTNGPVSMA